MNVSMSQSARSLSASMAGSSTVSQPSITARQAQTELPSIKNGNFGIKSVEMNEIFSTGGSITLTPVVFNGFVSNTQCLGDPDTVDQSPQCSLVQPGLPAGACPMCYRVTLRPSWAAPAQSSDWNTLGGTEIGANTNREPISISAPQEAGSYTVDVELEMGSGTTESGTVTVEVVESTCSSGADCPSDQVCSGGVCITPGETCTSDADCPEGQACDGGECVSTETGLARLLSQLSEQLGLGSLSTTVFAAIAPGLLIVVLALLLLPP